MSYTRKTVPMWQFEVMTLMWLMTAFFAFCLSLNIFDLQSKAIAYENKEVEIAKTVSQMGKLLPTPSPEPTPEPETTPITLIVSWYNPALGGVNCAVFMGGECVSKMANGQRWQDHMDEAIACPRELEFGTKIRALGEVWTCRDRGGAIKKVGDKYWIDMLTTEARVPYGTVVTGEIL